MNIEDEITKRKALQASVDSVIHMLLDPNNEFEFISYDGDVVHVTYNGYGLDINKWVKDRVFKLSEWNPDRVIMGNKLNNDIYIFINTDGSTMDYTVMIDNNPVMEVSDHNGSTTIRDHIRSNKSSVSVRINSWTTNKYGVREYKFEII